MAEHIMTVIDGFGDGRNFATSRLERYCLDKVV